MSRAKGTKKDKYFLQKPLGVEYEILKVRLGTCSVKIKIPTLSSNLSHE